MPLNVAAAYVRVSTDDQLEYSPDSQLKVILDAARRDGFVIPDEYVFREEDGISGKSADKRPAFRRMIAKAKTDPAPFSAIYVWKFSRFARNQEESIVYKNLLRKRGVSVRSVSEPSPEGPFSSLIERIIEWMDEYYLINLSGEVKRGMAERMTRGGYVTAPPFGYRLDKAAGAWVEDPDRAELVRWIFRSYADGVPMRTLAVELGRQGVRTKRGNLPDNRWIKYVLMNPAYIGKLRWCTQGRGEYSRATEKTEGVIFSEGSHPPLIDADLWEQVQTLLLDANREGKYRREGKKVFALKGLVRCGACGATLTLASVQGDRLQCCAYNRGKCAVSHSVSVAAVTEAVISALETILADRSFTFSPPARRQTKKAVPRDWERLISSEELKLKRARDAMLEGVFSPAEFKDIRTEIERTISELRQARSDEEAAQAPPAPDLAEYAAKVSRVLDVLKAPDVPEDAKNAALRSVIDHITYHKPAKTLDFFFIP